MPSLYRISLPLIALAAFSACASVHSGAGSHSHKTEIAIGDDVPELDTTKQLQSEVARLRVERERLAETNAVLQEELKWAHEDLRLVESQFTTFEERLTAGNGKASAVAAAAEARMRYDAMLKRYPNLPDSTSKDLVKLMSTSETLLRKSNYPAALFFADRANHTMISFDRREHLDQGSVPRKVAVAVANLREGPGTYYGVLERLNGGDKVVCTDSVGAWYHVRTGTGTVGWMHASLLK